MSGQEELKPLISLVPPGHTEAGPVDWRATEEALGTGLPSDYKAFMSVYGAGNIGDLVILGPLPVDYPQWDPGSILDDTPEFRLLWEEDGGVPGITADSSAVLPWGVGCNANHLGWLTLAPDPDEWPVVAWRRQVAFGDSEWKLFDCSMVGFLTKMMRAEFDECPLGDTSLWGRTAPFVHWRERQRRWLAGRSPKTGEPDPVVQDFLTRPAP
ncbi:SMI1/KNR4 family protein [Nocardiopsis sediminis]|uniref:SMI1/KNR4 family protein n=1 Tax=Nocardiopsis sediminis TaxID=1778267 RepID=A0ABV8FSU1_9ACTN